MNELRPARYACVIAIGLAATVCPLSAQTPAPAKVLRVKYMVSRVWTTKVAGGYSKLVEGVYAPEGSRVAYPDGEVHIEDRAKGTTCILYPDRRLAVYYPPTADLQTETKEDAKLTERFNRLSQSTFTTSKRKTRKAELHGYSCTVTESELAAAGHRIRTETWEAIVGGYPIPLREMQQTYNGDNLEDMSTSEVAEIEFMSNAPADLLAVPGDYKIGKISKDDLRSGFDRFLRELPRELKKR